MFFESIGAITNCAIDFVKYKYPKEFNDPSKRMIIFDAVQLCADELAEENCNLFIEPFISQLATVDDVAKAYGIGDVQEFTVWSEGDKKE